MNKKIISNINDVYITLILLSPFILFYLNGFLGDLKSFKYPFVLTVVYTPLIVWTVLIRKSERNAKLKIGELKLYFSLQVLPIVTMLFVNFSEPSFLNTINVYIVLMTALFFALDGQTDLLEAFKQTKYFTSSKTKKLADQVYSRLLRRFIVFLGLSVQMAAVFFVLMRIILNHSFDYPFYLISIITSIFSVFGCFFWGWFQLALTSFKKIRKILNHEIEKEDELSTWINLLYLSKNVSFFITWFPLVILIVQTCAIKFYSNISSYEILLSYSGIGVVTYILIRFIQYYLFKKVRFF